MFWMNLWHHEISFDKGALNHLGGIIYHSFVPVLISYVKTMAIVLWAMIVIINVYTNLGCRDVKCLQYFETHYDVPHLDIREGGWEGGWSDWTS